MRRTRFALLTGTLLLAGSALVNAQNAYTSRPTNVHAGPDPSYPLVAQLAPGTPVDVDGCLDDWSWCDVAFDDTHGWVYSPSLAYVYEGDRVPFYSYAPSFGLPIITFSLGSYWDRYYRRRPWFRDRDDWEHRRIPHRRPPGPPPRSGPPPRGAGGFRAEPRGPGSGFGFRPRGGAPERGIPERGVPERGLPERGVPQQRGAPPQRGVPERGVPERRGVVPERGVPQRATPERGPREGGNFARPETGRQITPHRGGQRAAPSGRGEPRGEQGRGGERPQGDRGDNRRDQPK